MKALLFFFPQGTVRRQGTCKFVIYNFIKETFFSGGMECKHICSSASAYCSFHLHHPHLWSGGLDHRRRWFRVAWSTLDCCLPCWKQHPHLVRSSCLQDRQSLVTGVPSTPPLHCPAAGRRGCMSSSSSRHDWSLHHFRPVTTSCISLETERRR